MAQMIPLLLAENEDYFLNGTYMSIQGSQWPSRFS